MVMQEHAMHLLYIIMSVILLDFGKCPRLRLGFGRI